MWRIRLVAGSCHVLSRLALYTPVHSGRRVLVSCKHWRTRHGRPGDREAKGCETAHGRRGERQPRDDGPRAFTCAHRPLGRPSGRRSGEAGGLSEKSLDPFGAPTCIVNNRQLIIGTGGYLYYHEGGNGCAGRAESLGYRGASWNAKENNLQSFSTTAHGGRIYTSIIRRGNGLIAAQQPPPPGGRRERYE